MTRINTIDPALLPMPWLVAEYRELPRILNRVADGKPFPSIPATYRMGEGHVSFFGNKLHYLYKRHALLRAEMLKRGAKANIELTAAYEAALQAYPRLCQDWTPSAADHFINLARLQESWFRAKKMNPDEYFAWMFKILVHHDIPTAYWKPLYISPTGRNLYIAQQQPQFQELPK